MVNCTDSVWAHQLAVTSNNCIKYFKTIVFPVNQLLARILYYFFYKHTNCIGSYIGYVVRFVKTLSYVL